MWRFFSVEAWFHLTGYVNSQNTCTWLTENPHAAHETSLHPVKSGVWCAASRRRIVGPIFFFSKISLSRSATLTLSMNSSDISLKRKLPKHGSNKTRNWMNWKPTQPTSLPTFHPRRCRQCLRTCFFVRGYVCNMLVHKFKFICKMMYCKHLTLNKVIHIVQGSHLRPPALPLYIPFIGFSFIKITLCFKLPLYACRCCELRTSPT